jgi:hypothetical protein
MTSIASKVAVSIISRPECKNGSDLYQMLKTAFRVDLVDATLPSDLVSRNFIGLPGLDPVEIAIAMSHHKARVSALEKGYTWNLFLEEDAIVQFDQRQIIELLGLVEADCNTNSKAIGIHLFPEQFGILVRLNDRQFFDLKRVPDFAVGYLLNYAALELSVKLFNSQAIEVADWPHYMRKKILWKAPLKSLVLHPNFEDIETLSSTKHLRISRSSKSVFEKLMQTQLIYLFLVRFMNLLGFGFGRSAIGSEKIRSVAFNFPQFTKFH